MFTEDRRTSPKRQTSPHPVRKAYNPPTKLAPRSSSFCSEQQGNVVCLAAMWPTSPPRRRLVA
eukprot:558404-Pyramimonas_sp.AAC.1